jgi:hypothetical protein
VTKACRYDPDLNPTYQEMAMYYGVGVVPARPYKPQDKAKVESGVQLAERWIIAALRHRKFFSIEELNQAIRELRDRINQRPFRKREGSRATQFAALDKPALTPLPAERFDLSEWSRARVNIDYHIAFDTNYYSVPYNLGAHNTQPYLTWSATLRPCRQPSQLSRSSFTSKNWWKCARRRRPSRSSTRVNVWRHTYARMVMGTPSRLPSTVRVLTRRIWNGRRREWCIGLRL